MTRLRLEGITKQYPGVLANDHIDLEVEGGTIHALIGENGAGKSTLMSILFGVTAPDEGRIVVDGQERRFHSPRDAIAAGLGMVFQSFKLFPELTVAENVVFSDEPTRHGFIDVRRAEREVAELSRQHGLDVVASARVADLPVGVLQRVEILKALYRHARVLILDEPTAVLTPQETGRLFQVLRGLAASGHVVILITHKLREVMEVADSVTVLRDGRAVASLRVAETSPQEISRHMTGRNVDLRAAPPPDAVGEVALRLEGVAATSDDGTPALQDVSLAVRAGEVLGIVGVAGNGQSELAEVVAGLRPLTNGAVRLVGEDVTGAPTARRRAAGLAYIPEDRHHVGTAEDADAVTNLAAGYHRQPPLRVAGRLRPGAMRRHAEQLIDRFQIRIASPGTRVGTLSGGNLQKIVVAREIGHGTPVLVAEQPTRGVDIGAIEFIHREIVRYRDGGGAVLLISNELSEIFALSSRIAVMFEGRVLAEMPTAEASEESVGLLMAGITPQPATPTDARTAPSREGLTGE